MLLTNRNINSTTVERLLLKSKINLLAVLQEGLQILDNYRCLFCTVYLGSWGLLLVDTSAINNKRRC